MTNKRVLIIDDEVEIRRYLTLGLTAHGYTCTTCPDGISAIHELDKATTQNLPYHYLVTDIFMPDIDGLKILKVIKKMNPELPVVVMTGFGDEQLKQTALSELNTAYLDKSFDVSELVEALQTLKTPSVLKKEHSLPTPSSTPFKEVVSGYLTVRITDPQRSSPIFDELYFMNGIVSCEAVKGHIDIVLIGQAETPELLWQLFERVKKINGLDVASSSLVERPKLDKDIKAFIKDYKELNSQNIQNKSSQHKGTTSYLFVDIDPKQIQHIFTMVYFIDEVIFCDVLDQGSKLVGMIYGSDNQQRDQHIVEKLKQVDGILRVRETKIIKLKDM